MYNGYHLDQEEDLKKMLNITKRTHLRRVSRGRGPFTCSGQKRGGSPYPVGPCVTLRQAQDDF